MDRNLIAAHRYYLNKSVRWSLTHSTDLWKSFHLAKEFSLINMCRAYKVGNWQVETKFSDLFRNSQNALEAITPAKQISKLIAQI